MIILLLCGYTRAQLPVATADTYIWGIDPVIEWYNSNALIRGTIYSKGTMIQHEILLNCKLEKYLILSEIVSTRKGLTRRRPTYKQLQITANSAIRYVAEIVCGGPYDTTSTSKRIHKEVASRRTDAVRRPQDSQRARLH